MSTFLVSLGVVAATIAAVVHVALSGPDQPATIRRPPSRERKRQKGRAAAGPKGRRSGRSRPTSAVPMGPPAPDLASPGEPAPAPSAPAAAVPAGAATAAAGRPVPASTGIPAAAGPALADSDPMRIRVLPAKPTTLWVRIRSAVALVVLVAVLGALLAVVVGAVLVGAAFLIRSATG